MMPVIGIGASAGGIDALAAFLDAMPADSGCAFVIVMHLDPARESGMAAILATHTAMPVAQIQNGMRIAPDHVYVIAPGTELRLQGEHLLVAEPVEPRGHRHPVDVLFSSIAAERREHGIAIVLSGTGSNGTEGLKAIRAEGGMSLAQTPETAKFDGMPRSAIAAGMADHVLAPEQMPEVLLAYLRHGYLAHPQAAAPKSGSATVEQVLDVLRVRGGHDFTSYKRNTLRRRIHRRMGLANIDSLDDYLARLRSNPDEVATLVADLMISVTGFFRDRAAWAMLEELVIAPLIAGSRHDDVLRVWVPACATGEEAYSIAMLLAEHADAAGKRLEIKVFATDAQEANLKTARDGVYPAAALADLPPERMQRFFVAQDGNYHVTRDLRDMVVFAAHNLLRDPPFSRMNIVCCRNLLIYLEPEAQQRVVAQCHFALVPDGHLFLGNAETLGRHDELFETVSEKWRIYRRVGPTRHDLIDYHPQRGQDSAMQAELASVRAELRNTIEHLETANEKLKASNEEAISMNEELQSTNEELETSKEELQSFNEELNTVNSQLQLKIAELEQATNDLNNLLAGSDTATLFLDHRLAITWFSPATRQLFDLASTDIGRPIAHFARKFSDENLLSDAKAVLEQLTTIEAEVPTDTGRWFLRRMLPYRTRDNRIAGVVVTFSDITARRAAAQRIDDARLYAEAIIATVRQPLLVLDDNLRVQTANAAFLSLFQVKARDISGSLLYDLGNGQWNIPALRAVLDKVMTNGREVRDYLVEHDFRDLGPRAMLLSARKLVQQGGQTPLILLAIEDITERKRTEDMQHAGERRLRDLLGALPGAIYTTDTTGRIQTWNAAAAALWGREPDPARARWLGSLRAYRTDGSRLPPEDSPIADTIREGRVIAATESVIERPDGSRVPVLAYPAPLFDEAGKVTGAVIMLVDISERKQAELVAERLAAIVESSDDAIISKDLDGTVTSWNTGAQMLFGFSPAEAVGQPARIIMPPDRLDEERDILARVRRGEHTQHFETLRQRKDASTVWVSLTVSPIRDGAGRIIGASMIARDMTERHRADMHRKTLMDELNHRVKNTMAVVQAIASQTLLHASDLDEARKVFGARLMNLARAHEVLTRDSWHSARLPDLVLEALMHHPDAEDRFRVSGPEVRLKPSAALALSMALHELGTNAVKYGALSVPQGHVEIRWWLDGEGADRRLTLHWREQGGPPVRMPERKGFGSRLIEQALAAELDGDVHVSYKVSGLECEMVAPLPEDPEQEGNAGRTSEVDAGPDRRG